MTLDQAIEFIMAKFALMIDEAPDAQSREVLQKLAVGMENSWNHPRLSLPQLRSIDGEMLEMFLDHSFSPQAEAKVREQLVARFKTSRLRAQDKTVVRRVLKRGEIADMEEYYQVKEYVSCVDHIDEIGEENYARLDSLLETYDGPDEETPEPVPIPEKTPSRRRPPPPFDHTLVGDEKLCPPDTPLETRVRFIRAKFSHVIASASSPQVREALQNQLKWGIDFTFGPNTPPERRAATLELCEHEAEFFCGYEVGGTQHRDIEEKLEMEFGFRRLGPSAQSRLARMLATNDALDSNNRMFIGRFIYNFPHQTLFTRSEIKRARQLMNEPSPSQPYAPMKLTPRPKTPPDLSLLCVGAVFKTKISDKPCRVIAFDDIEVFHDVDWGEGVGWSFGDAKRRAIYYRVVTPLFLDGAEKLRVDPPGAEFLALHRPDLPLRFGRSIRVQWSDTPLTRDEFAGYVQKMDPALLDQPPLPIARLALITHSRNGAMQTPMMLTAENGTALTMLEVLWHAHQHQRPFKDDPAGGIGFYRSGLEKKGTPSYFIGGFLDRGGALKWLAEAPPAP